MKKKKNFMVKLLAIFALLGIVISIIGTALLVITSGGGGYDVSEEPTLTPEQLQEIINSSEISVEAGSAGSNQ